MLVVHEGPFVVYDLYMPLTYVPPNADRGTPAEWVARNAYHRVSVVVRCEPNDEGTDRVTPSFTE